MTAALSLSDAIDQLIAEEAVAALPTWTGAPLGFTSTYHSARDLDKAAERRRVINAAKPWDQRIRHGWKRDICGANATYQDHTIATFTADTRCLWDYHDLHDRHRPRLISERIPCECVGDYLHLIVCDTCELHWISADENHVVEQWHDHAFPGWRDLPTLPAKLRGTMGTTKMTPRLEEWFQTNYPAHLRTTGAPILTDRTNNGTRHVPAYSPYGGFDLASQPG